MIIYRINQKSIKNMNLSNKKLFELYLSKLSVNIIRKEKIDHEESLSSEIYKLYLKDGSNLILKMSYNNERWNREIYFLNKLKNIIPVPMVIEEINPDDNFPGAILMECLQGTIIHPKNLNDQLAYKMGILLAQIHSVKCEDFGDIANNKITKDALTVLMNYYLEAFDECKNHLDTNLLNKIEKFCEDKFNKPLNLDGPCIVHRDFKLGNIMVKNNNIIGIFDWELAYNGFAEDDFCQLFYLLWEDYPKTKNSFLQGYSSIRKLPLFDNMPLLRACKSLGAIGFTIKRKTYNSVHKFVFDKNEKYLNDFFNLGE